MTSATSRSLPLDGVRVVDLTRMFAGPWAAEILADLGASVVKIEEPRIGDPTRRHRPLVQRESSYFMTVNRGKKSLAIDARTAEGQKAVLDLIRQADIVVENFRPGVTTRLGIDYKAATTVKSDIVYCSLSGFGATGPMKDRISFDIVNQAFAGLIDITGHPNNRAARIGVPIGDLSGGLYMAVAVLAGLHNRNSTGLGCWIDLGLHDTLISLLAEVGQQELLTGASLSRVGNLHHAAAPYGSFRTSDGWLAVIAVEASDWERLCEALEIDDEAARALRSPLIRSQEQERVQPLLERAFVRESTDHWIGVLRGAGISCEAVVDIRAALDSPEMASRQLAYDPPPGKGEGLRMIASPMVFDGARLGIKSVAPTLGQHSIEILAELGFTPEEVDALVEAGTVKVAG